MENIELSESLVKELFVNWLPRIWFTSVDENSSNIARVVCDFGLMDCRRLNNVMEKFWYEFQERKLKGNILGEVDNIIGI